MGRGLLAAVVAALLLEVAAPAAASDVFVGVSTPGASDAGPCADPSLPCATIGAAVAKSVVLGGGRVVVLPNPDGRTTDAYAEDVVLDGSAPVTLAGAGRGPNGTMVAPTSGTPLTLGAGTSAAGLRIEAAEATGVAAAAGSTLDDAIVEAPKGVAYDGAGRVEDSRLVGMTGARLDAAQLVRTEVVATRDGLVAWRGSSRVLEVVVRPRTATGEALRVGGEGAVATAALRGVTLIGYPMGVHIDGRAAAATLQAANATFAAPSGTDLELQGPLARAQLHTVDESPGRTVFADGAQSSQLGVVDPLDVAAGTTPDGNLAPGSPLIDRGTLKGALSGSPDRAFDIHGDPRNQGAAPDVGADETAPPRPDSLRWVPVGSGFIRPMWVASPPGDLHRVFVVERAGVVKVLVDGQLLPTPALNLTAKVGGDGEGGLESIAFAPDFATSHHVYGYYTLKDDPATPEDEWGDIVLAEWTMDANDPNKIDPASERQLMYIEHSARHNHYGGTLLFGPDGNLWISTGDGGGGMNPFPPQVLSEPLGKILRIDPNPSGGQPYTIPADNPFVGQSDARPEIWAYGVRNAFRMAFDPQTGDLWIADVGNHFYEEVNLLRAADGRDPGANLGWDITEGDVLRGTDVPVTPENAPPNYLGPVLVRRHDEGDIAIIGGSVVQDPTIASLDGHFIYADFGTGFLRSVTATPAGGVIDDGEVQDLAPIPQPDSFSTDGCGRVYATSQANAVYRLTTTGQCAPPPSACTITGTPGDDVLTGTSGPDVICGLGGNDRLYGLGGGDVLYGGPGNDVLSGGAGADVLQGGSGSDVAVYTDRTNAVSVTIGDGANDGEAGEGDDVQLDVERVSGGSGDDHLTAGSAGARLQGGAGNDTLTGGPGADVLNGGLGNDDLVGGAGKDTLLGGDGDDTLDAADGQPDALNCGAGIDTHTSDPVDTVDASCE